MLSKLAKEQKTVSIFVPFSTSPPKSLLFSHVDRQTSSQYRIG